MLKVLFVVNARSGRRRKHDLASLLRSHAGQWTCEIVESREKSDLDRFIELAEREGVDVVYAVGGDGTVHETAKRLIGRRPALGILPTGSGNGFARHIGLPMQLEPSLRSCREGRIVTIDTADVDGRPFLGVMGLGFDALVAHRFASSSVRGLQTYVKEGMRAFVQFRAEEYAVQVDGREVRQRAAIVAVANSSQYGNNVRIAPLASLQDGLLDVVLIGESSLAAAALMVGRLFTGSIHRARGVTTLQGREIELRRAAPGPAHLDGEPVELPETMRVRIVPQSLRLLVPGEPRPI